MSEHTERSARTAHEGTEHLTFAGAAERLHISPNAVRMRIHRGTLTAIRVHDRTYVVWPQPARTLHARTPNARADERSPVQDDALIAQLRDEIAFLRQQLDHQTQITGMMARRLAELPAPVDVTDGPQERKPGSPRGDVVTETSERPIDRRQTRWR